MGIAYEKKRVLLSEVVSVEDAEGLLEWLQSHPHGTVDLAGCTHLHAANLQVLLAANAKIKAWPAEVELRAWLEAALSRP